MASRSLSGTLSVDVLVADSLGARAKIGTVRGGTAFPAKGVTQALARTELVPVAVGETVHWVPRPNLLGAIVAKATASVVDRQDPDRHRGDVAFLCGLVADPVALADDVTPSDRRYLRRAARHLPADAAVWRPHPDAHSTFEFLAATPTC
jgi:hypothetical protein